MNGQSLTFSGVDGIAFAAARGKLSSYNDGSGFSVDSLGPLLELIQFAKIGLVPPINELSWLNLNGLRPLSDFVSSKQSHWICPDGGTLGFLKTSHAMNLHQWNSFSITAHKACLAAGFASKTTSQLIGALGEMHSNLYEHSGAADTGLIAFRIHHNTFEFTIADCGIGVLQSLKTCGSYSYLSDHGEALRLVLSDGVSRFDTQPDRGKGFRPLFIGLANLNGFLRFRSGDHALIIEGERPTLVGAKTAQKPLLNGFFASVACKFRSGFS